MNSGVTRLALFCLVNKNYDCQIALTSFYMYAVFLTPASVWQQFLTDVFYVELCHPLTTDIGIICVFMCVTASLRIKVTNFFCSYYYYCDYYQYLIPMKMAAILCFRHNMDI